VTTPAISVIVPTCARPQLLAACLARLAPGAQSFAADRYEVIVTDDGRDSVAALVQTQFPWARWTRGPQRGPAANRNHGASLARSDWLAFTDDDCLPEPNWLSSYHAAQTARPTVSVWSGRTYCRERHLGPFRHSPVSEGSNHLWACNLAIDRATFHAVQGFDAAFPFPHLEDVDLHRRLLAAGAKFGFCGDAAVEHPPRPVGPIGQQARSHASYFYFARKHRTSLREAGLSIRAFLRWRWVSLRSSRTTGEALRFCVRCLAEALCLAPLMVWWATSGRPRP
jgi:GT2 family glycosyltransferase